MLPSSCRKFPDTRMGALAVGVIVTFAFPVAATVELIGSASGRFLSGNTLLGETEVSAIALPDDGSTGPQIAQNYHISAGGIGSTSLSIGVVGSGAGVIGASDSPNDPLIYNMTGTGGDVRYQDELTVTSGTLALGTPVTIQFSYHVHYFMDATNSAGGQNDQNNWAQVLITFTSNVSSTGTGDSFSLSSTNNHALLKTIGPSQNQVGLFAAPQHVDVQLNTEVGATISYNLTHRCTSTGKVASYNTVNQVTTASCNVGIAFGATAISTGLAPAADPDVVLQSARTGGAFSSAAGATAQAAQSGAPSDPLARVLLPVSSAAGQILLVIGLLAAGRRAVGRE
jgi:hypothetical protein